MTLWNIIRDFFVHYVFGGLSSDGRFFGSNVGFAAFWDSEGAAGSQEGISTEFFGLPIGNTYYYDFDYVRSTYLSMGDWLSTTATIIVLVGLFIAITLLIISLFKWIVRLVSLRG